MGRGNTFNIDFDRYIINHKKRKMTLTSISMVGQGKFSINILDLFEFLMISNTIDETIMWH